MQRAMGTTRSSDGRGQNCGGAATTVVSADRGLTTRVGEVGAATLGPGWLLSRLDAAGAREPD